VSGPGVERVTAEAGDTGRRLDAFLAARLPTLSRSRVQQLIRAGHVAFPASPDERVRASTLVTAGLVVEVTIPAVMPASPQPEALPLSVLHDDDDMVVIDKPAGLVVHPGAGHSTGTLVNALLHHVSGLSGIGGSTRPGIVHRLDRGTSGVMVVAKHDAAHRELARQFHDRTVTKEYVALVWGTPREGITMTAPIGRHPNTRVKMSTRASRGREAVTRVIGVEPLGPVSLVRVSIGTGRTHQIRVHLSEAGHPVVGDALYGGTGRRLPATVARLTRPFLHASRLAVTQPTTRERLTFTAELPPELADILVTLRRGASEHAPQVPIR
jgi:23S rRNA pseudouridine1911/1915/1917 synthase